MMVRLFLIILPVLLSKDVLIAQKIKILDAHSLEALSGVYIYNASKKLQVVSDSQGIASLDIFSEGEPLKLHLFSYNTLEIKNVFKKDTLTDIHLTPGIIGTEVLVTKNKLKQRILDLPAYIDRLKPGALNRSTFQTTADLLGKANGVFIQKSQQGGGSPMIRGFAANRILLVVDGVRINNAIFRSGNLQNILSVNPGGLERVDVLFGPNSLIYGSDALGGVIHMHSKKVEFASGWKGLVSLSAQSANTSLALDAGIQYGAKRWSFSTQVGRHLYGNLKMGSNGPEEYLQPYYVKADLANGTNDLLIQNPNPKIQRNTGFEQRFFNQQLSYRLNATTDINYSFIYSTTGNVQRYDRLIRPNPEGLVHAEWYYGPQRWFFHKLSIVSKAEKKWYSDYRITTAYQNQRESRNDRKFGEQILRHRKERVRALSLNADFRKEAENHFEWRYGTEWIHNRVNSKARAENVLSRRRWTIQSRYPDGATFWSSAFYLQASKKIDFLQLSGGLRFQHTNTRADFSSAFLDPPVKELRHTNNTLVWSLGANFGLSESFFAYANYSKGFRAPNIDDLTKVFDSEPGSVVVPNPELEAEKIGSIELGFQSRTRRPFDYHISVHYSDLIDFMTRQNFTFGGRDSILYDGSLSQVQAILNAQSGYIFGAELKLNYTGKKWELGGQAVIQQGRLQTNSESDIPIRHIAPNSALLHIARNLTYFNIVATWNYNAGLSFEQLAPSELSKSYLYAKDDRGNPYAPAWWTIDLSLDKQVNSWTIEAGLYNLFDKRYRPYSSGIAAAGRNVAVSLRYSW